MSESKEVVVDTNIFVAAGFNPGSASGTVVQAVRDGRLRMMWTSATRHETRTVLEKIPPLDWSDVEPLFRDEDQTRDELDEAELGWVHDEPDRKFAALARALGAVLITNDDDLLADRSQAGFPVLRSREFVDREL